jgi:hypothetical protein
MKMKMTRIWIVGYLLAAGCATRECGWTETSIGVGRYSVKPPEGITQITGTNSNPTIWVHECGRIQVQVKSLDGTRQGDVWINWLDATVNDEITEKTIVEPPAGGDGKPAPQP